jgi:epoxyqueuosine reductase
MGSDGERQVATIVETAKELGASLAGIAIVRDLKGSPSYEVYNGWPYYEGYTGVEWPEDARSVLVLAVAHPPSRPELDWWSDDIPGRTPGNRLLIGVSKKLREWLSEEFGIGARSLPYAVETGGVLLKDAATLAGLGIIGKNNLLVAPELGTLYRLRALFLDADLPPTGPLDFDPCDGCDMPCRSACPRDAFRNGSYELVFCEEEMKNNRAHKEKVEGPTVGIESPCEVVKFCRACEYACPVATAANAGTFR